MVAWRGQGYDCGCGRLPIVVKRSEGESWGWGRIVLGVLSLFAWISAQLWHLHGGTVFPSAGPLLWHEYPFGWCLAPDSNSELISGRSDGLRRNPMFFVVTAAASHIGFHSTHFRVMDGKHDARCAALCPRCEFSKEIIGRKCGRTLQFVNCSCIGVVVDWMCLCYYVA